MTNEEFQNLVLDKLANLNTRLDARGEQINKIYTHLDALGEQIRENTDLLKAIVHNEEIMLAEIKGLKLTTASTESQKNVLEEAARR